MSFAEQALAGLESGRLVRVAPSPRGPAASVLELCRRALRAPIGARPIGELAARSQRIVVIVSDATRDEPRAEMLEALFEVVPRERVTLLVSSGTHAASAEVVPEAHRDLEVVVHDAQSRDGSIPLGTTEEGTEVLIARAAATADLVIVTGRIRPHYFAGYSGGVKGLFPGCAHRDGVLHNHRLKSDPTARLGRVDDNRCRLDMEAAASRVAGTVAVLNVLCDVDGHAVDAASGHAIEAHRALCERARELFVVRAPRAPVVVVADRPPVSRSLYQASKLLPPAGALLEPGGVVIMVAECDDGVEPLERVNEGIYRIGVARQLPDPHRVVLVSRLDPSTVARTYAAAAPSLEQALAEAVERTGHRGVVPVLWRAGESIAEASPGREGRA